MDYNLPNLRNLVIIISVSCEVSSTGNTFEITVQSFSQAVDWSCLIFSRGPLIFVHVVCASLFVISYSFLKDEMKVFVSKKKSLRGMYDLSGKCSEISRLFNSPPKKREQNNWEMKY